MKNPSVACSQRRNQASWFSRVPRLLLLAVVACGLFPFSAKAISITVNLGRQSQGCSGFGICSIVIGTGGGTAQSVPAEAAWVNGRLQLDFQATPPNPQGVITIDEDIVLDSSTSQALGYQNVTVKAGQYPVDYSTNPHGTVTPNAAAIGVTVTIDVGRKSKNCTGFGVCSIIIGVDISLRSVPAAATLTESGLQFDLLAEPPDKTNVMVIDEDIVLDGPVARALGYEHATVLAGTYPVDFSTNPHGTVTPAISGQGLVINIEIGRASQGCAGFGICSVTIGPLAASSARSVQASATLVDGQVQLSFLSEPPDKSAVLTVDQDIVLTGPLARRLGAQQITVRPGQYPVDFTTNPHGTVRPNTTAEGIVITIDCRYHCDSLFGFCKIVIDLRASARTAPAMATWTNGGLQLDFLAEPPDKTNVLVLDEDMVLDAATSGALSSKQVTLRAGSYPIDYSTNPHGTVHVDAARLWVHVDVNLGRGTNCTGSGICSIVISWGTSRCVPAAANILNGGLTLELLADPLEKTNLLEIDHDIVLDDTTARLLGYQHVTILPGMYPVDYSANPHGTVRPAISAQGLVVTIYTGRKSQGCTGFGVCKVTIDWLASDRAVPAVAAWSNGKLSLDYLSDPPDKSTLLTIDEDIVLDPATALALGSPQMTIKAGQYPVDYSTNPHGSVTPDVARFGIVVEVNFGRGTNCAGFGVCSIYVGPPRNTDLRTIPTSATWTNGGLQLDFLTEPPDKTNVFVLDNDIVLDVPTAQGLGYQHVTLKAGSYPVDFSTNPHGTVTVGAEAQGIIITIKVARPGGLGGCGSGFGFCIIIKDVLSSARNVQAAANWVRGQLHLDFLSDPPEMGSLLFVDQDVVLDDATSQALGYEHVTIKAGQYPVDYSTNPHGTVTPATTVQNITITIKVGRPSKGCSFGLGICSITINPFENPSARSVVASASETNGALQLNFLSEPPDKTNVFSIEQDIVLDDATSRALGYEHATLLAGDYPVDFTTNPHGTVMPTLSAKGIIVTIGIGRSSDNCAGFGFCLIIKIPLATERAVPASATWVNGQLQFSLLAEPPDKTNVLVIDQDIQVDPATARALGYQQLTVKAGSYPVDYSSNPHGVVTPNVIAQGIVITIDCRYHCDRWFGFCRITIDPLASERAVQASASWSNGRLKLDFLADPPDKTNVLVLDQDIVLDENTSRALGYQQVKLRAGTYPIDYSTNPHGTVSPDAARIGVTVTINIGRASKGCAGFGVCSIVITLSFDARAVPTAATWAGGRLQLAMLSEPPDKTNSMVIDEDIVLDSATAQALGYKQVTVRAGTYPVDYSTNPHGTFSPNVTALGLVISVDIGRRSQGCAGFGICRITIEPLASTRAVFAAANVANGLLQLSFLGDPPDKSPVLMVDEDVILDSRTSRLLGYDQIKVPAGQYPVSFATNPFGQTALTSAITLLELVPNGDGTLGLSWPTNGWILQESPTVLGPWTSSTTQTSPFSIAPGNSNKLYRLTSP